MSLAMNLFNGASHTPLCAMKWFSLLHASIMLLLTRYLGSKRLSRDACQDWIHTFRVASESLIVLLSKSESLGIIQTVPKYIYGRKKMCCVNTMLVVSHEGFFSHLDLGFQVLFMMLQFSITPTSINVGIHTSFMMTDTLNTCLEIPPTLVRICLLCRDLAI